MINRNEIPSCPVEMTAFVNRQFWRLVIIIMKIMLIMTLGLIITACSVEDAEDIVSGEEYGDDKLSSESPVLDSDHPLYFLFSRMTLEEAGSDFVFLKNAPYFATGGIGYAGQTPEIIHALRRLFKEDNALEYFRELIATANVEGRLFALSALYFLDNENFHYLIENHFDPEETIIYISGCIVSNEFPIYPLLYRESAVRLMDTQDTLREWLDRYDVDTFSLDFYGGGIPCALLRDLVNSIEP